MKKKKYPKKSKKNDDERETKQEARKDINLKKPMKEEKKLVVSGCNTIFCQPHSIRKKNIKNEHENRHHLLCCNICTRLLYYLHSPFFPHFDSGCRC